MSVLVERLFAVHEAFSAADIPHAFGGAIALAYCTNDPRGTRDLDVNVFLPSDVALEVIDRLPSGISSTASDKEKVLRDAQVRLDWDGTPVDLFFNNLPFHEVVARGVMQVPLEGRSIPVLDGPSLIVFKAMFDRTKDWADIEAVVAWDPAVAQRGADLLVGLVGPEDRASRRLKELLVR